jgi:hypothetical protein
MRNSISCELHWTDSVRAALLRPQRTGRTFHTFPLPNNVDITVLRVNCMCGNYRVGRMREGGGGYWSLFNFCFVSWQICLMQVTPGEIWRWSENITNHCRHQCPALWRGKGSGADAFVFQDSFRPTERMHQHAREKSRLTVRVGSMREQTHAYTVSV